MVRVFIAGHEVPGARAGDEVRVTGQFRAQDAPGNPGEEDSVLWDNQSGSAGSMRVGSASLIEPVDGGAWDRVVSVVLRARAALQARAQDVVARAAGDDPGRRALFESLMLGRTQEGEESGRVSGVFMRLGLLHVLSISGFHLTVMAALVLWLVRMTGDRGRLEPILLGIVIGAYMAIVPASSPIMRSGLMVVSLLVVEASGRRYDRVCVLGWIAVVLLLWRPMDLWSLGFQLSLGLTAMLLSAGTRFTEGVFTPPLKGLVDGGGTVWQRTARACRGAIAVSLMCWIVSLPVIMHATGLVSPLAALATVVISPVVVLLLWVGYIALLAGVFVPGIADVASGAVGQLGTFALWATSRMDALPLSSVRVPPVPAWWAFTATIVAVVWAHNLQWGRWKWLGVWGVLAGTLAGAWALTPALGAGVVGRVDVLNVGDGTCMIVRAAGDGVVMWDCKKARGAGSVPGVVRAARKLGVWRVKRVVVTHPDLDHFSGLPEVIEPLGVEEVVLSRRFVDVAEADKGGAPAALLRILHDRGVRVTVVGAGDELTVGGSRMRFVWPDSAPHGDVDNEYSLVAVFDLGRGAETRSSVLLTGDVQQEAVGLLRGSVPPADVMELPHHGAYSAAVQDWVTEIGPRVVLQSTGRSRVRDPRWAAMRGTVGAWLCTAERGWASVEVLENGEVRVNTMRR